MGQLLHVCRSWEEQLWHVVVQRRVLECNLRCKLKLASRKNECMVITRGRIEGWFRSHWPMHRPHYLFIMVLCLVSVHALKISTKKLQVKAIAFCPLQPNNESTIELSQVIRREKHQLCEKEAAERCSQCDSCPIRLVVGSNMLLTTVERLH